MNGYNEKRVDRVIRFIENLTLWEGRFAGQKLKLADFQKNIIRNIYGPCDEDGQRLVRTAAIWLPRANAKTSLAAALALAHFMGPEAEAGGQVIMAAADRENASIAFNHSWQMAQNDDTLRSLIRPVESRKRLFHPRTSSQLMAISSEAYSKQGLNCSFFLSDEIHVWQESEARPLWGAINKSMLKRENPLTVLISTAGYGQGGLAHDLWRYSQQIHNGEREDPAWFTVIYQAHPDQPWDHEDTWRSCNPGIDAGFVSVSELANTAKLAKNNPADVTDFKRFHLNQWIDGADDPWVLPEVYDAAETATPTELLQGQPCWLGVDLSSVSDLTAVVAVFPADDMADDTGARYDVLAHFFLPAEGIENKADEDRAGYMDWVSNGCLTLTEGRVVDYDEVVDFIFAWCKEYDVREIGIDRWNSSKVSAALLAEDLPVVEFGMGYASMASPVRELKRALLAGHFRHGGNPALRSCFMNVAVDVDPAENMKFTKARSQGRIDGCVAAAIAVGRIMTQEPEEDWSLGVTYV